MTKRRTSQDFFMNRLNGYLVLPFFTILLIVLIPPLELTGLFLDKKRKKILWRRASQGALKILFYLGGLRFKIEGLEKIKKEEPILYIANHGSMIDGFILTYLLGTKVTPFTGPANYFPFPFSHWFKRMECIDVQRSEIESLRFKDSYDPPGAIKQAIAELKHNNSVLLFPEGHVEPRYRLMYFHTGAARIALASEKKVAPIGIINIDKVIINGFLFNPGNIKIVFHDAVDLRDYYIKNTATIKEAANKLRKELSCLLPRRYYPLNDKEVDPTRTAVFLNIDHTLYNGQSQKNFVKYLCRMGSINFSNFLILSYFYFLDSLGLADKDRLINDSAFIFKGWRADRFYKAIEKAFERELKFDIFEKMNTILKDHKEKGHKLVVVTEKISPLAKCFADYIDADYLLSSHPEEKKRRLTGRIKDYCSLENQAKKIINLKNIINFDLNQSFVYTNDIKNLQALKKIKYKTLINPHGQDEKEAREKGWEILKLS
jgi:1-acyl-sn-glycerol-3-phosphate acyltransferase